MMLDIVANTMTHGPRLLPATKKSAAVCVRRMAQTPMRKHTARYTTTQTMIVGEFAIGMSYF